MNRKITFFLPVSFIFFSSIFLKFADSADCSKTYVVPLFSDESLCLVNMGGAANRAFGSYETVKVFLEFCRKATRRSLITTLNVVSNTTYTCLANELISTCGQYNNRNINARIKPFQKYYVMDFLDEQLKKNQNCNDSMIVFLVNVFCIDVEYYPDLNQLFGHGLQKTHEFLLENNVHAYVIYLNVHHTDFEICGEHFNYTDFNETNNLKTIFGDFNSIFYLNHKTGEKCEICKICDTEIPHYSHPDTTVKDTPKIWLTIIISAVCGAVFIFLFFFATFWVGQIWKRWKESKIEAFADQHSKSAKHIFFGKYLDEWEVTPKELKVDQGYVLGKGAFATVYKGRLKKKRNNEWIEMDVATKFPHIDAPEKERQDMISEIGFMKALGSHENLLVMVGYVKSIENPVICTVFCANGDLLNVLKKHPLHFMSPEKCNAVEICLLLPDLLRISLEVCNGLCYLSSFNYVHRDIAARNVLLADKLQAKLSDFGLCKKMEFDQNILVEKDGKFPIKQMSHEALKFGEFSEKSDVWSFGVLIFEIFSGGAKPFDKIQIDEFLGHLESGGKPEFPEETPDQLLQILNDNVFQLYPSKRKTFKELKEELKQFYRIVLSVVNQ